MGDKVLLRDVHVTEEDNTVTILKAGTSVPKKLAKYVTNPKAYAPDEVAEEAGDGDDSDEEDEEDQE